MKKCAIQYRRYFVHVYCLAPYCLLSRTVLFIVAHRTICKYVILHRAEILNSGLTKCFRAEGGGEGVEKSSEYIPMKYKYSPVVLYTLFCYIEAARWYYLVCLIKKPFQTGFNIGFCKSSLIKYKFSSKKTLLPPFLSNTFVRKPYPKSIHP